MLGELYEPKGLALETACAVLETPHPWAINMAKRSCAKHPERKNKVASDEACRD
jgi:hypothetical protein